MYVFMCACLWVHVSVWACMNMCVCKDEFVCIVVIRHLGSPWDFDLSVFSVYSDWNSVTCLIYFFLPSGL